ncbi:DUF1367 family protein [Edwardsiella tarda]
MSSAQGKSPRRHKAEALGVLLPGDRRNLKHHRKFFKLLALGMQYWVPAWEFVSRSESWVAHAVARRIAEAAADPALYDNVTRQIAQGC